jgi:hypothetical protein
MTPIRNDQEQFLFFGTAGNSALVMPPKSWSTWDLGSLAHKGGELTTRASISMAKTLTKAAIDILREYNGSVKDEVVPYPGSYWFEFDTVADMAQFKLRFTQ